MSFLAEIRPSYSCGIEMSIALSTSKFDLIIHRFWVVVGYSFLVFTGMLICLAVLSKTAPYLSIAGPVLLGCMPIFGVVHSLFKGKKSSLVTHALGLVIALPFGMACSALMLSAIGLSAMAGMRW